MNGSFKEHIEACCQKTFWDEIEGALYIKDYEKCLFKEHTLIYKTTIRTKQFLFL